MTGTFQVFAHGQGCIGRYDTKREAIAAAQAINGRTYVFDLSCKWIAWRSWQS